MLDLLMFVFSWIQIIVQYGCERVSRDSEITTLHRSRIHPA